MRKQREGGQVQPLRRIWQLRSALVALLLSTVKCRLRRSVCSKLLHSTHRAILLHTHARRHNW